MTLKAATWKEAQKNQEVFSENWDTIVELMEDINMKKLPDELNDLLEAINDEFADVITTIKEFTEELTNASIPTEEAEDDE